MKPTLDKPRILPLGDGAVIAEFAASLDLKANALCRRVAAEVRRSAPDWIVDVVPALVTVTVHFAAGTAREASERREACVGRLADALARARGMEETTRVREVEIPVCYAARYAPDLEDVAARTGLAPGEVVRAHIASPHRVLMIGFAPGHPYMGGLDLRLSVPRRATPRPRVEAGSVAIANAQSVVYPYAIPGGWNIIGRTPLRLFDPQRDPPSLVQTGDRIRFVAISETEFERLAGGSGG